MTEDDGRQGGVSRRTVVTAGAWALPVIAVAVGAPAAAASTTGGVLYVTGNAFGGAGIFLSGSNYNGFGASGDYAPGEVTITFVLPEGVEFTVDSPDLWLVTVTDNVVTISNGAALTPSETGDLGDFSITGDFAQGSTYDVSSAPPGLDVQYVGNVGGGVFA
ncbi:hypothetical protein N1031_02905 [Herbiconiux moechotypicola]|uniref:Uncharacterized protein n=1 Tax=Herbiconiux moechotypicola TaxID=637393 RepID=A0ABP5QAS3_9MICO|nr:hypothetical protein [Herbiconiux moechotypicola]MCS5728696.1 hypothetical protein [Herbiconiux moechotypicola]